MAIEERCADCSAKFYLLLTCLSQRGNDGVADDHVANRQDIGGQHGCHQIGWLPFQLAFFVEPHEAPIAQTDTLQIAIDQFLNFIGAEAHTIGGVIASMVPVGVISVAM